MMTIKKILCPLDFSEPAYVALATARALAASCDAELLLVHVVPFPAPNPYGLPSEVEAERFASKEAEGKLRSLLRGNERFVIYVGDEASQIIDAAKAEQADIIVMSTHGLTGWRRIVIGSVTEKVLRQSDCPVLTVRRPENMPDEPSRNKNASITPNEAAEKVSLKKILCPIDFSAPSYAALETAGDIATKFDAELCVLYVMEPLDLVLDVSPKEDFDTSRSADAAHQIYQAIQKHLPTGIHSRALVENGEPAAGILRAADKEQVDLIVIATHGLSGWKHFMFGSVAEEVVRTARHPVLTVRSRAGVPSEVASAVN